MTTESSPIARGQTRLVIQDMLARVRDMNVQGLNAAQRRAIADVLIVLNQAEVALIAPNGTLDNPEPNTPAKSARTPARNSKCPNPRDCGDPSCQGDCGY